MYVYVLNSSHSTGNKTKKKVQIQLVLSEKDWPYGSSHTFGNFFLFDTFVLSFMKLEIFRKGKLFSWIGKKIKSKIPALMEMNRYRNFPQSTESMYGNRESYAPSMSDTVTEELDKDGYIGICFYNFCYLSLHLCLWLCLWALCICMYVCNLIMHLEFLLKFWISIWKIYGLKIFVYNIQ